VVVTLALAAAAEGQTPGRELLNSERITRTFGSYGVEIVEASAAVRVSNLFSAQDDVRTCRTLAVVRFPSDMDAAVAKEHAEIVAGGSIGAVFAANGWEVRKTHLNYGEIRATQGLARLMHVAPGTPLAEHAYVLDVARDGRVVEYAALVEIHHPDYLRSDDLRAIYGTPAPESRRELLATLLATAAERTEALR
jgi:hypothetical protein